MDKVKEVVSLFFKLGLVAFGGPAAHIAMFHKEVVDKRKWMSEEHYLDLIAATSLIPGPNSTEMAIHCGFHRAGKLGLFLSGAAFIFPATVFTIILAAFYTQLQTVPNFEQYISGIRPAVMVLIFVAVQKLWKKAIKTKEYIWVFALALAFCFTSLNEIQALFFASLIFFFVFKAKSSFQSVEPLSLLLVFLKVGSILFGSGYVLISYLQKELVLDRAWLTTSQLADAIAFGQFTPGPVLSSSSFVGYLILGLPGALIATLGIFLPSFIFVWILNPLIPKMRNSESLSLFLNCINAGVIGIMCYALVPLGKVSLMNISGGLTFALAFLLNYFRPKLSSFYLIIICAIFSFAVSSAI